MPTVLIAGASRGIGLEFARQYAADGWRVIAGCRRPEEAKDLAAIDGVAVEALDTTSGEAVAAFRAAVGETPLDLLVAVAGISAGDRQTLGDIDYAALARVVETNVAGPLRLAEAFAANLEAGRDARLIAISSVLGSIAETASSDKMLYRISKAALNEAWRCIATDLAPRGVTAMLLHPGWVATDMGGPQAPVTPAQSVRDMRALIAGLGPRDAGTFRDHGGRVIPW